MPEIMPSPLRSLSPSALVSLIKTLGERDGGCANNMIVENEQESYFKSPFLYDDIDYFVFSLCMLKVIEDVS